MRNYTLFILLLLLASCDKKTTLTYKIKNVAYDPIKVVCVNQLADKPNDTFIIRYNELKTIAVNWKGFDKVYKYKESGDKLHDFKKMDIYKYDTLLPNLSKTDFLQSKLWSYTEKGAHAADYTTTVTTNDF